MGSEAYPMMASSTWDGSDVSGNYDVIVIGAGIMGSCTAYEIAKRGLRVLLLEQFDFLHRRGSSHGESRIIRRTYPEDHYTQMMSQAYELWDSAHREAGYSVLTPSGGLDFGPPNNKDFQSVLASCKKHNVPHDLLTAEEVRNRFPFDLPSGSMAIYSPDAGVLHATKAVAMFQQLARNHGVVLRDRATVSDITTNLDMDSETGTRYTFRVSTTKGTAYAKHCVVAAGAWTSKLLATVGELSIPIQPLHTTVVYWQTHDSERFSARGGFPLFINYDEPYIYGMPANEYPGLIKVSLHAGPPCDPDKRSLVPSTEPIHRILKPWMRARFGDLVNADIPVMAEACLYSMTPDQDYILDWVSLRGEAGGNEKVLVAAGFSGHGFKMGPLIGKIMADMLIEGTCCDVPMEYFSLERFKANAEGNQKENGPQVRPHEDLSTQYK